ncbi:endolytic transglycosylase MltG [Agromyces sp. G08B096]|uniref:Endolytic murein transglycosylase n=1 Tax=Agromyces sp. G08B096 TaxID=3156399 RepID=A0AAU7WBB9_9MICO
MTRRELREAEQRRAAEEEAAAASAAGQGVVADATGRVEPPRRAVAPDRDPDEAEPWPAMVPAGAADARSESADDPFAGLGGNSQTGSEHPWQGFHDDPEPSRPSRAERRAAAEAYHVGESDPPKRKRRPWGCLIGLLIVAVLGVGAYVFLQGPITAVIERFQPAPDYEGSGTGEVTFMIHEGDTGSDIAERLAEQDITASYDAFYELLLAETPEPEFQPGAYRLAEQMSAAAALEALMDPSRKLENTFVIPEGAALPDALQLISEGTGVPLDQLQAAAAEPPANYGLPPEATTLEGFLFPATYTLDPGLDAHAILQTLVNRQFEALDAAGVPADQRWKTIVLASIVQREAGSDENDFPKVARVFQNRLDQGINLESDATVAYGTGNTHTVWTTDAERADASNRYNTYANPGLPIGPIGNPGDVAINAAIHPADGSWLFFVPVNLATGETVFSTTVEEHEAAVARLQEWCQASDENASYCE